MRHLRPGSITFTMLLGAAMATQMLGIYITLPILPTLAEFFSAEPQTVQLTTSAFLGGVGASQIVYGALADRFGRRPVLLVGLLLYALASFGCSFSPDIGWLIALRALQGVGAAGGIVISRAMVRDLFERSMAVQMMSRVLGIAAAVPLIAPLVGAWLLPLVGWRGVFDALGAISIVITLACAAYLGESIRERDPAATDPRRLLANAWRFLTTPACRPFVAMIFFASGCMFGYSANSAFMFMDVFGLSGAQYGWLLSIIGVMLILAAWASVRIARRWSIRQTLKATTLAFVLLGLTTMAGTVIVTVTGLRGPLGIAIVYVPALLFFFTMGIQFNNIAMAALHPVPDISGVASAVLGSVQMLGAGFFVWFGGLLYDGTALNVGYGVVLGSVPTVIIYYLSGRHHAPERH